MYIHTFDEEMKRRFGRKIYRLSLDGGFTCPNRDGTLGDRGCAFCSGQGSGNFAARGNTVGEQLADAKRRIAAKTGRDCGYIAYFQSFTGTYAPVETLRRLFSEGLAFPEIEALAVATRPDCLPPQTLALLTELNAVKPVWVELGLQTANDRTAAAMNRRYPTAVYDEAVAALHENGIEAVTHMILGLPGETEADMLETARHIADAGSEGIKLQLLHVLRGTRLAEAWRRGEFDVLSLEAYTDLLCKIIPRLPREMTVHRYTGDGDKKELLAPLWSADKKRVLNTLHRAFRDRDVEQGALQLK